MGGSSPLPGEGSGGAGDDDRTDGAGIQLGAGELESRARLARARGRREQKGTVLPVSHPGERPGLPHAQLGAVGLGTGGGHGSRIVKDAPDETQLCRPALVRTYVRMIVCVLVPRFALSTALGDRTELLQSPVALAPEPGGTQQVGGFWWAPGQL